MTTINIGKDFSLDPAGRYVTDNNGKGNDGSSFREKHLKKEIFKLKRGEKLIVILDDGVESYGSSFLTEGFAGMVKFGYIKAPDLVEKLDIKYTKEDFSFFKKKIYQYIKEARYDSQVYDADKRSD